MSTCASLFFVAISGSKVGVMHISRYANDKLTLLLKA
jgi:hypothetical protein